MPLLSAEFNYDDLKDTYGNFVDPLAVVNVGGKILSSSKVGLMVTAVEVSVTAGFEASQASFDIHGLWDDTSNGFELDDMQKVIAFGNVVSIALGYGKEARTVFVGYVAQINYCHKPRDGGFVRVTCMDVKAQLMARRSLGQYTDVRYYSKAVSDIISQYKKDPKGDAPALVSKLSIYDSPDKPATGSENDETAVTIETTDETEYEFCVRAAKKFNYEFFVYAGEVVYRSAKSNSKTLMIMSVQGMKSFDVEYNTVGIVGKTEVRALDPGKGTLIKGTSENSYKSKLTAGGAKSLTKVYIDPSVRTEDDATYRANYLMEENSYKLGTLRFTMIGLPELTPGRFIYFKYTAEGRFSKWYIYSVTHEMNGDATYLTHVVCRANTDELET